MANKDKDYSDFFIKLRKSLSLLPEQVSFFIGVLAYRTIHGLEILSPPLTERLNKSVKEEQVLVATSYCSGIYQYISTWMELYLLCFPDVMALPTTSDMSNFVSYVLTLLEEEDDDLVRKIMVYKLGMLEQYPPLLDKEIAIAVEKSESFVKRTVMEFTQKIVFEARDNIYLMDTYIGNKKGPTKFGRITEFKEL